MPEADLKSAKVGHDDLEGQPRHIVVVAVVNGDQALRWIKSS